MCLWWGLDHNLFIQVLASHSDSCLVSAKLQGCLCNCVCVLVSVGESVCEKGVCLCVYA